VSKDDDDAQSGFKLPISLTVGPAAASFAGLLGILQVAPPLDYPLSDALTGFAAAMPLLIASSAFDAILSSDAAHVITKRRIGQIVSVAVVGVLALVGNFWFLTGVRGLITHFDEDAGSEFFGMSIVLYLAVAVLLLFVEGRPTVDLAQPRRQRRKRR
jgi:hypothetical protein